MLIKRIWEESLILVENANGFAICDARREWSSMPIAIPFHPELTRKNVTIQANATYVRIFHQGKQVACHNRSYGRRELIADLVYQSAALQLRRKQTISQLEESFLALSDEARQFHLHLLKQPIRLNV